MQASVPLEDRANTSAELERDVTILVKAFERPESLRRLLASIRCFYPRIPVLVVDDSASPLDPIPEGVTRYFHLPYNSVGLAGGRNFGLRQVETKYVVICEDDMVLGRKTDLHKMLHVLETTRFDIVSCRMMDHDPWRSIRLGRRRYEGTVEMVDGNLVRRLGVASDRVDGLPVFDVVANFFMASVERLGDEPWDARLNFLEHNEFFIAMKERGLLCTSLPDVVVYHHPQLPSHYYDVRVNRTPYLDVWRQERGFDRKIFVGRWFSRRDRVLYYYPGLAAYAVRRALRLVARRLIPSRTRA
jgi:glycosyltransferase involved in cell wall biosynthesis